tara:strand:+ start:168724 stop:169251 length:528 start_codon:yes stop_codon:yes gene_type:complete
VTEKITNFSINLQESIFIRDYKNFYKRKYSRRLLKLVLGLITTIVIYLVLKYFTEWNLIEIISFALIFLILNFVLFKAYDLYSIIKKIKRIKNEITFGQMNLIIKNTFIEINHNDNKRVIFLSQLKECVLHSDCLFFIEKNQKHLPFKVSKSEMNNNSFEILVKELESMKVNVIK